MAITFGSEYVFKSALTTYPVEVMLDETHFVVAYNDANAEKGRAVIGTISNTNQISYGTTYEFNPSDSYEIGICKIDSTRFVITFQDAGNNRYGTAIIGTVSGGSTISFGSEYVFNNSNPSAYTSVTLLDSTHIAVCSTDSSNQPGAVVGTISSGNVITFGSRVVAYANNSSYLSICSLDSTHFAMSYSDNNTNGYSVIGVVSSGNVITFGTPVSFGDYQTNFNSSDGLDSTHFVISYHDNGLNTGRAIIGVVSNGNVITFGSNYQYNTSTYSNYVSKLTSTKFIIAYRYAGNGNKGIINIGTISSGNVITFSGETIFNNASTDDVSVSVINENLFSISYRDVTNSNYGTAIIGTFPLAGPANLKSYNTNLKANIKSINTNLIANVKSLDTNI